VPVNEVAYDHLHRRSILDIHLEELLVQLSFRGVFLCRIYVLYIRCLQFHRLLVEIFKYFNALNLVKLVAEGSCEDSFASAVSQVDKGASRLGKSPKFLLNPPEDQRNAFETDLAIRQATAIQTLLTAFSFTLVLSKT